MMSRSVVLIAVVVVIIVAPKSPVDALDVNEASSRVVDEILRLKTHLKFEKIESSLRNLQFKTTGVDSEATVAEMSRKLSAKFTAALKVAGELKREVEVTWGVEQGVVTAGGKYGECCKFQEEKFEYDTIFKSRVDRDNACYRSASRKMDPFPLHQRVQDKMKKILQDDRTIKWQHFGTQEGQHVTFPATIQSECHSYDPRQRPWYVLAAAPKPKQIVIVMDASESMVNGQNRLDIVARDAVVAVLRMLSPIDSVGLVYFTDYANTPNVVGKSCFGEKLAKATQSNVDDLVNDLTNNYRTRSGGTDYVKGLKRAYEYFHNSEKDLQDPGYQDTIKIILFLSDGRPSYPSEIVKTVLERPAGTLIFTFGFGDSNDNWTYLEKMANRSGGEFVHVSDPEKLRESMGVFYNHIANETTTDHTVITLPYIDALGMGMMITVAAPIVANNKLVGVLGVDLTLDDMLEDVSYFRDSQSSYAFVIDGFEQVIMHPLLPLPFSVDSDPITVKAEELERSLTFREEVLDKLKLGKSGSREMKSNRIFPRGDVKDGVDVVSYDSVYAWSPIQNTSYSVVVVQAKGEQSRQAVFDILVNDFPYHRIDLYPGNAQCKHLSNELAKREMGLKFSLNAWKHPARYLDVEENNIINSYMVTNHYLRDGVREMASFTSSLDKFWDMDDSVTNSLNLTQNILYKYIATPNGVLNIMPLVALNKAYLPQTQTWYRKAILYPGKVIMTAPYLFQKNDKDGIGITIAQGMSKSKTSRHADLIIGIDFSVSVFEKVLQNLLNDDNFSFFIIDDDGYFIYNEDFSNQHFEKKIHITENISYIAEHLINENLMYKRQCVDYHHIRHRVFYKLENEIDIVAISDSCDKLGYMLKSIPNTNTFLGRIPKRCWTSAKSCYCDEKCSSNANVKCECPCALDSKNYNHCGAKFDHPMDEPEPCAPEDSSHKYAKTPLADQRASKTIQSESSELMPCVQGLACQLTSSRNTTICSAHADCSYCFSEMACLKETESCPLGYDAIVVICVVVAVVAVGIIFFLVARHLMKSPNSPLPSASNVASYARERSRDSETASSFEDMGIYNGGFDSRSDLRGPPVRYTPDSEANRRDVERQRSGGGDSDRPDRLSDRSRDANRATSPQQVFRYPSNEVASQSNVRWTQRVPTEHEERPPLPPLPSPTVPPPAVPGPRVLGPTHARRPSIPIEHPVEDDEDPSPYDTNYMAIGPPYINHNAENFQGDMV